MNAIQKAARKLKVAPAARGVQSGFALSFEGARPVEPVGSINSIGSDRPRPFMVEPRDPADALRVAVMRSVDQLRFDPVACRVRLSRNPSVVWC